MKNLINRLFAWVDSLSKEEFAIVMTGAITIGLIMIVFSLITAVEF